MSAPPRKIIVTLAALLILVLIAIALLLVVHIAGGGEATPEGSASTSAPARRLAQTGLATLRSGAAVPWMRLLDARSGAGFDTAGLRGRPYVVVFLSVRCGAIGSVLRRAIETLGTKASGVAVLGVSADPQADTERSARAWLAAHDEPPSFHFLIGDRRELRPYWKAWGVAPEAEPGGGSICPPAVPLYLVSAEGRSAGVIYAGAHAPSSSLAHTLRGLLDQ